MQYPLLVLLVGWLVVQVLLAGSYFTVLAVVERGNVARVWLVSAGASLVTQIDSNRIGGYIKERQFAGCVFYWHESNSGGD